MSHSLRHWFWISSLCALAASSFAACGGLDGSKRARVIGAGGDPSVGGDGPASGGSSSSPGGQGGEGGAPPMVDGPPQVVAVSPTDMADDAEPGASITIEFNEGLDSATVTADSIQILDGASPLAGELSYSGVTVTFVPAAPLSLLATYDVQVSTAVQDRAGTAMAEPFASAFKVREGAWSAEAAYTNAVGDWDGDHDLAIDANGNALVVWSQTTDESIEPSIFARWYRPGSGWEAPKLLESDDVESFAPSVAVSPSGDAVVAWVRDNGGNFEFLARRYVGGAWETNTQRVDGESPGISNTRPSVAPFVAAGASHFIVGWIRITYTPDPFSYRYDLELTSSVGAGAWQGDPYPFWVASTLNGDSLGNVTLGMDAAGNALILFQYYSPTATAEGVYYGRYAATGSDFVYPVKIEGSESVTAGPRLAMDEDGSAMAVWAAYDTALAEYELRASRYTKALQFADPIVIDELEGGVGLAPHAIANDGANFLVAWGQEVGASRNIYANRYITADTAWLGAELISDGDTTTGLTAALGADRHGNAIAAWDQSKGDGSTVAYARFVAGEPGAWQAPRELPTMAASYGNVSVVVAPTGVAGTLFEIGGRDQGQGPAGGPFYSFFE